LWFVLQKRVEMNAQTGPEHQTVPPPGPATSPQASAGGLPPAPPGPPARVVFSRDLLLGDQELHIDHDGAIYRLRVTQNGKLILYK
jgi:hemin uptake protein HemP